jgi:hypothetical protein
MKYPFIRSQIPNIIVMLPFIVMMNKPGEVVNGSLACSLFVIPYCFILFATTFAYIMLILEKKTTKKKRKNKNYLLFISTCIMSHIALGANIFYMTLKIDNTIFDIVSTIVPSCGAVLFSYFSTEYIVLTKKAFVITLGIYFLPIIPFFICFEVMFNIRFVFNWMSDILQEDYVDEDQCDINLLKQ